MSSIPGFPNILDNQLLEIEAKEACDWLKAAGFPQYAQLYEDLQFPVDIETVKSDHEFLDQDAIESLYRRLNTLNKCAAMKVELSRHRKRSDESEEDEPCAISNRWEYQRHSKRWSRLESSEGFPEEEALCLSVPASPRLTVTGSEHVTFFNHGEKHDVLSLHSSSSSDSDSINFTKTLEDLETSRSFSRNSSNKLALPDCIVRCSSPNEILNNTEERLLEKPPNKGKSLLRKMEKLRLRNSSGKRSVHSKNKPIISGPTLLEGLDEDKLKNLNCVNICDLSDGQSKRSFAYSPQTCSSSSQSENSSTVSTPSPVIRVRRQSKRGGVYTEDFDPTKLFIWNDVYEQNEKNLHENLVFQIPQGHKPGTFPKALTNSILSPIDNTSVNWRTGSFHGCRRNERLSSKDSEVPPSPLSFIDNRLSIYDNVPGITGHLKIESPGDAGDDDDVFSELDNVMEHVNGLQKLVHQWTEKFSDGDSDFANDSTSPCPSSPKEIHLEREKHLEEKLGAVPGGDIDSSCNLVNKVDSSTLPYITVSEIESPLTRSSSISHWSNEQSPNLESLSLQIDNQFAGQLNRIQKMALLKLTALMDKYTPSSKQGWNWTIPKFIRKTKAPDYKDKNVFGVPFALNVQRTGHPVPKSILQAMEYLRAHFLDQVGLFRKSGVKSRIQALREMNELDASSVSYEGQSAFDVADMLKQYFRDLPEPIFTSKLCESFLHIYQYLPKDQEFYAVQAAILLLPDENREALKSLLFFLRDVVACVQENQMTPTNLAVCLAPSLFHLNTLRKESSSSSRSSQRKYSLGKPDQRDLSENLAATQGLAHMIAEGSRLFQLPDYCVDQYCGAFPCEAAPAAPMPHSATLIFLESSMQNLLRDSKDKFRSWTVCSGPGHVELAYKKVEDVHPVRLWKVSAEIEASPKVILQHILREQHAWDPNLVQAKVIKTLDEETEIYHYTTASLSPLPLREYVVLRTWRTDPQSGTCVLAATSVHDEGVMISGTLGHVLLCQHLLEATGPQKSRVTHVCRIDTRGRTTEWYNRVFGHMCAAEIARIKDAFTSPNTDQETNI
ncbi:rho GTPase-activating protein 7-like isoform X2 [Rhinatrema bivittatum]|uniref:rho GTPase-activating protein 7-like isoform X2 n=1 Tax=Rhinatrema bivittatum TaxID=194408 RepID=UPI001129BB1D|nr:rho GTPase-activating protein 7-like isoform X2 [Rhinatrema bivittatum]XP_029439972.1 rho GTPase-activating protein 7-like isoform X2 [Rhinatrema bivittatum]